MALPRSNDFPDKELKLAEFMKTLSHPARIMILKALAQKKTCICGELVADLPLAQSTVSQHLKALKKIGIIKGEIVGPKSRYCINWKVFERYQKHLSEWSERMLFRLTYLDRVISHNRTA